MSKFSAISWREPATLYLYDEYDDVCPHCTRPTRLVGFFKVLAHWNNSLLVDMTVDSDMICSVLSRVRVMVLNATFNNISVILWRSVLLVLSNNSCCFGWLYG